MIRQPYVEIYLAQPPAKSGLPWSYRPLVFEGKAVGRNHLKSFNFTYTIKGDDTCSISLAFNKTNVNLQLFKPGNRYKLVWGYKGGATASEDMVVDDNTMMYNKGGLVIGITMITPAAMKTKSPGQGNLAEQLKEKDLTFTYRFYNAAQDRTIEIQYSPVEGKLLITKGGYEPRKHSSILNRPDIYTTDGLPGDPPLDDLEYERRLWGQGLLITYGIAMPPPLVTKGVNYFLKGSTLAEALNAVDFQRDLLRDLLYLEPEFNRQEIEAILLKGMIKFLKDASVGTKGDSVVVTGSMRDRPPRVAFSPDNIISLKIKEVTKKLAAEYTQIVGTNPIDGSVTLASVETFVGPINEEKVGTAVLRGESTIGGNKALATDIVNKNGELFFRGQGTYGDTPLTQAQREEFKQNILLAEAKKTRVEEAYSEAQKKFWDVAKYPEYGHDMKNYSTLDQDKVMMYNNQAFIASEIPRVTSMTTSTLPSDQALLQQTNAQLDELYNKLGANVVVEGNPSLREDFNFILSSFPSLVNGVYISLEIVHNISRGGYKTTIKGGLMPKEVTAIYLDEKLKKDKTEQELVAKYKADDVTSRVLNVMKDIDTYGDAYTFSFDSLVRSGPFIQEGPGAAKVIAVDDSQLYFPFKGAKGEDGFGGEDLGYTKQKLPIELSLPDSTGQLFRKEFNLEGDTLNIR